MEPERDSEEVDSGERFRDKIQDAWVSEERKLQEKEEHAAETVQSTFGYQVKWTKRTERRLRFHL